MTQMLHGPYRASSIFSGTANGCWGKVEAWEKSGAKLSPNEAKAAAGWGATGGFSRRYLTSAWL